MEHFLPRPTTVLCLAMALLLATPSSAQEAAPGHVQPAKPAPAGDTRAGPRLVYTRGPVACLTEAQFRDEVALILDGVDHFRPEAKDVMTVSFEKVPAGFRGTSQYTDAQGNKEPPEVKAYSNCEILGRWVAGPVSGRIPPPPPPPPPSPALACDPCAAAAEAKADAKVEISELRRKVEALNRLFYDQDARAADREAEIAALQAELREAKKNRMDLTGWLSAGAIMTANLTSNVGPAVYVGGELRSGPLSLGLDVRFVIPAPVYVDTTKEGQKLDLDLSQVVGLLTPCGHYSYFFGCAVAGAGVEVDYDSNFSGGAFGGPHPLLQLGGRIGAEIPVGDSPLGVRAWGEVLYGTPSGGVDYHINHPSGSDTYSWTQQDVSAFFGIGLVVKVAGKGAR